MATTQVPTIDIEPLRRDRCDSIASVEVARQIDAACRRSGFFRIVGHGIPASLFDEVIAASRSFFDQPDHVKAQVAMERAGRAWRGWFPVGGELTAGRPDRKEGLYLGVDHPANHPRVRDGTPLHGANLYPRQPAELRHLVPEWLHEMAGVARQVMRAVAVGLGLDAGWFESNLTGDPTILLRIFHYPPSGDADPGVGEHTDYGLLTLLAQDGNGGLQVRLPSGWVDVPPDRDVLVCNLGDMLEVLTGGRYRSTPHRVIDVSDADRISLPFFFDPSWDATVPSIAFPPGDEPAPDRARWDGADPLAWTGTYGEYLTAKVAKVFPHLFARADLEEVGSTPAGDSTPPVGGGSQVR